MLNPWLTLSFKAFQLGIEAQSVVALRMMRLASGGAGTRAEMGRMIQEKAAAVVEAQFAATAAAVAGNKDHVGTLPSGAMKPAKTLKGALAFLELAPNALSDLKAGYVRFPELEIEESAKTP